MKRGSIVTVKSTGHTGVVEGFVTYSSKVQNAYVRFPESDTPDELYQFSESSLEVVPDLPGTRVT